MYGIILIMEEKEVQLSITKNNLYDKRTILNKLESMENPELWVSSPSINYDSLYRSPRILTSAFHDVYSQNIQSDLKADVDINVYFNHEEEKKIGRVISVDSKLSRRIDLKSLTRENYYNNIYKIIIKIILI